MTNMGKEFEQVCWDDGCNNPIHQLQNKDPKSITEYEKQFAKVWLYWRMKKRKERKIR